MGAKNIFFLEEWFLVKKMFSLAEKNLGQEDNYLPGIETLFEGIDNYFLGQLKVHRGGTQGPFAQYTIY